MQYYGRPASPKRDRIYSANEIMNNMNLCDLPEFHFVHRYSAVTIDYSAAGFEKLKLIPGFLNTRWQYLAVSHEMKPMFQAMDNVMIGSMVNVSETTDENAYMKMCDRRYHAIPKPELILPVFLSTAN